jgi:SmpA / OmlA family
MKRILLAALLLTGCVETQLMNKLSVGMTKQQVIAAIGRPDSVSAVGRVEMLKYFLTEDSWSGAGGWYVVALGDGRVMEFGAARDLSMPAQEINLNVRRY